MKLLDPSRSDESGDPRFVRIGSTAVGEGLFNRQLAEPGSYGHVILRVESSKECGMQFVWDVDNESIPLEYKQWVLEGVLAASAPDGPLCGRHMTYTRVTVIGGSWHPIDSRQLAFKRAAYMAIENLSRKMVFTDVP